MTKPFIVTLTGPSCAGKTTLEKRLIQEGFVSIISTTTRPPRAGEVDGDSYYFVSKSEFKRLKELGAFIETVEFNGNYYGASAKEVKKAAEEGKPIVIVVEPEGLKQINAYAKEHEWGLFSLFIDNPPNVIAERFLIRFAQEGMESAMVGDYIKGAKTLATYSTRLGTMMTVESTWKLAAWDYIHLYLSHFDESNIDMIVLRLMGTCALANGKKSIWAWLKS
jgi:guanylate kinase